MKHNYSYKDTLHTSERIGWKVEDIIGDDKQLDFTKPFMPESLARVRPLSFLNSDEQLKLNQIRGHEYLSMFGLVENFILPFVLDHVRPQLDADDYKVRALLQFASEEAKHIHLFKRFREEFEAGFGNGCDVIGPPEEVSRFVLGHSPLGVGITVLHIEWITLRHYIESVRDDQQLDAQFKNLLKRHWQEESQHTKLDTLMVEALVADATQTEITEAFDEYAEIGAFLDRGFERQAELSVDSFVNATGRSLQACQRAELQKTLLDGMRWTYLGTGMTHPTFLATVEAIQPEARKRIEELAPAFC